jgi:hypothetical protein
MGNLRSQKVEAVKDVGQVLPRGGEHAGDFVG